MLFFNYFYSLLTKIKQWVSLLHVMDNDLFFSMEFCANNKIDNESVNIFLDNNNQKVYPPIDNSFYPPQQQQQHQQPPQFHNNPPQPGFHNPYNNNMNQPPTYQMDQIQSMPVVTQQPSKYKISFKLYFNGL